MKVNRRTHLTTMGGVLLSAATTSAAAGPDDRPTDRDEVLYGHGQVWNRALPGMPGEVKLSFDLRVNLDTGAGVGTAHDPVHPDWNIHFRVDSTERTRLRGGHEQFVLKGTVTHSNGAFAPGLPVRIVAQIRGFATAIAIEIGDVPFAGAGVVIALIAILLG